MDISIPFAKLIGSKIMVARGLVLESIGTKQNGTQEFVMQMQHDREVHCRFAKPWCGPN